MKKAFLAVLGIAMLLVSGCVQQPPTGGACGDNVCSSSETAESCPQDCSIDELPPMPPASPEGEGPIPSLPF